MYLHVVKSPELNSSFFFLFPPQVQFKFIQYLRYRSSPFNSAQSSHIWYLICGLFLFTSCVATTILLNFSSAEWSSNLFFNGRLFLYYSVNHSLCVPFTAGIAIICNPPTADIKLKFSSLGSVLQTSYFNFNSDACNLRTQHIHYWQQFSFWTVMQRFIPMSMLKAFKWLKI